MNVPPENWLERRFVPAAVVAVASGAALAYLQTMRHLGGTTRSVIGYAAVIVPPLFIGLVAGIGRPRAPVRHALFLTGLTLLLVAPLFGEGLICLVMMAPIYLAITLVVALLARAIFRRASRRVKLGALIAPWLLFAVDRPVTVDQLPIETARDEVVLAAPPEEVVAAIARLELSIPPPPGGLLRWGLPVARRLLGEGIAVGAERRLVFDNGTLVARVIEAAPPRRFVLALSCLPAGPEFFDHWAALEETVFELVPLPGGRTRLIHTTRYRRLVRPRVWFAPIERHGAHLLQAHLLAAFAERNLAAPVAVR